MVTSSGNRDSCPTSFPSWFSTKATASPGSASVDELVLAMASPKAWQAAYAAVGTFLLPNPTGPRPHNSPRRQAAKDLLDGKRVLRAPQRAPFRVLQRVEGRARLQPEPSLRSCRFSPTWYSTLSTSPTSCRTGWRSRLSFFFRPIAPGYHVYVRQLSQCRAHPRDEDRSGRRKVPGPNQDLLHRRSRRPNSSPLRPVHSKRSRSTPCK